MRNNDEEKIINKVLFAENERNKNLVEKLKNKIIKIQ